MKGLKDFVTTTIFGGLVFLVPVVLIMLVLRHALKFADKFAQPIAALFPERTGVAALIAVVLLVLVAFIAGLIGRTSAGRRVTQWFEESILGGLPQYQMAKTMAEGFAHLESDATQMQPVLVLIDEGWQIAYRIEELENGWVAVFVPQSPTPMSGNVMYVEHSRVRPLPIAMKDALVVVKRLGIGSSRALAGVELGALALHSPAAER